MDDQNQLQCIECGAINSAFSESCFNCGDALGEERRYRQQASAAPAAPAPAPAPAAPTMMAAPGLAGMGTVPASPDELPNEPVELAPDPWIGPIMRRTVRYRLSRTAIEIRSGLLTTHVDQVETYRIGSRDGDMEVRQGPIQKFFKKTGNLLIKSDDPDMPFLMLRDIHDPETWARRIRASARGEQMRRNRFNTSGDFSGF